MRKAPSWAGPVAGSDFGRRPQDGGLDEVTVGCFLEAMAAANWRPVGFRTGGRLRRPAAPRLAAGRQPHARVQPAGHAALAARQGRPAILEDVNEHPYRVERCLLQLHQAGVLDAQQAVLLGSFAGSPPTTTAATG
jgi:muramoyltetrapeptide carboxypeptidase